MDAGYLQHACVVMVAELYKQELWPGSANMIEKNFDISFIADLALREKQIQQNYRPIIAVHKWFARRPGTFSEDCLLSEFAAKPLQARRFMFPTACGASGWPTLSWAAERPPGGQPDRVRRHRVRY